LNSCIFLILFFVVSTNADEVNWRLVGLRGENIKMLYVHPETSTILYALVNHSRRVTIYRSVDGGLNWEGIGEELGSPRAFAISPGQPDTFYAAADVRPEGRGISIDALFKSKDGGESWEQIYQVQIADPGYLIEHIVVPPNVEGLVYLAIQKFGTGFYKSIDGGRSFRAIGGSGVGTSPFSFTVTRTDPEIVYWTGTPYGEFFKYSDATGQVKLPVPEHPGPPLSWPNDSLKDYAQSIAVHPLQPEILYAVRGTAFFGVEIVIFKSSDGGRNWEILFQGKAGPSRLLLIHPKQPQIMYGQDYGEEGANLYRSSDGGKHWRKISEGLENLRVNMLVYSEKDNRLYAGTNDGVYILDNRITLVDIMGKTISLWGKIKAISSGKSTDAQD
jgi:photosystem II stability/assembly factor-like uncharacterized protein